jgi:DNA-binding MarR family transcriptional regulator
MTVWTAGERPPGRRAGTPDRLPYPGAYNIVMKLHNREGSVIDGGAALERLFELALLLTDGMDRGLAERGLSRARAELLWRLRARSPLTQRELSQQLRCTPRNVTDLVDALEAAGLVARGPHPTDRRATLVSLTDQGQAAAARMQAESRQFAAELFRDLSPAELASFAKVVDHVLGRLRQSGRAAQGG